METLVTRKYRVRGCTRQLLRSPGYPVPASKLSIKVGSASPLSFFLFNSSIINNEIMKKNKNSSFRVKNYRDIEHKARYEQNAFANIPPDAVFPGKKICVNHHKECEGSGIRQPAHPFSGPCSNLNCWPVSWRVPGANKMKTKQ